ARRVGPAVPAPRAPRGRRSRESPPPALLPPPPRSRPGRSRHPQETQRLSAVTLGGFAAPARPPPGSSEAGGSAPRRPCPVDALLCPSAPASRRCDEGFGFDLDLPAGVEERGDGQHRGRRPDGAEDLAVDLGEVFGD